MSNDTKRVLCCLHPIIAVCYTKTGKIQRYMDNAAKEIGASRLYPKIVADQQYPLPRSQKRIRKIMLDSLGLREKKAV